MEWRRAWGIDISECGRVGEDGGTATSTIQSSVTDTGSISVTSGTLEFDGGGTFSGAITGAGTVDFGGGSATLTPSNTLATALQLTGATVMLGGGLTENGAFSQTLGILQLNGQTATMSGAVNIGPGGYGTGGTIDGAGTLATTGVAVVATGQPGYAQLLMGGGATWSNSGSASVGGMIQFGDAAGASASFINQAGGTFAFTGGGLVQTNNSSGSAFGTATFVNDGLLIENAGTGITAFDPVLSGNGTLDLVSGTLQLQNGGTLSGSVIGSGTIAISSGVVIESNVSIAPSVHLVVNGGTLEIGLAPTNNGTLYMSGGVLALGGNTTVDVLAQTGGLLDLNGYTLAVTAATATGPTASNTWGAIDGPGTLATGGLLRSATMLIIITTTTIIPFCSAVG